MVNQEALPLVNSARRPRGVGRRGGEAFPPFLAEAWDHCAPSSRILALGEVLADAEPTFGGTPAIQLDRATFAIKNERSSSGQVIFMQSILLTWLAVDCKMIA
jgi:hypothetical protein